MKGHTAVVIICFVPLSVLFILIMLADFGIEPFTRANLPVL